MLGEWTRIEIGHIKEGEDKYFLTLSIGGHEVARGDATEFGLWCKRDCQVYILSGNETGDARLYMHCCYISKCCQNQTRIQFGRPNRIQLTVQTRIQFGRPN